MAALQQLPWAVSRLPPAIRSAPGAQQSYSLTDSATSQLVDGDCRSDALGQPILFSNLPDPGYELVVTRKSCLQCSATSRNRRGTTWQAAAIFVTII